MDGWMVYSDGKKKGPFDTRFLQQMAASGMLKPTEQVWRDGWAEWLPAWNVVEVRDFLQTVASPSDVPTPAEEKAIQKQSREMARYYGNLAFWFGAASWLLLGVILGPVAIVLSYVADSYGGNHGSSGRVLGAVGFVFGLFFAFAAIALLTGL